MFGGLQRSPAPIRNQNSLLITPTKIQQQKRKLSTELLNEKEIKKEQIDLEAKKSKKETTKPKSSATLIDLEQKTETQLNCNELIINEQYSDLEQKQAKGIPVLKKIKKRTKSTTGQDSTTNTETTSPKKEKKPRGRPPTQNKLKTTEEEKKNDDDLINKKQSKDIKYITVQNNVTNTPKPNKTDKQTTEDKDRREFVDSSSKIRTSPVEIKLNNNHSPKINEFDQRKVIIKTQEIPNKTNYNSTQLSPNTINKNYYHPYNKATPKLTTTMSTTTSTKNLTNTTKNNNNDESEKDIANQLFGNGNFNDEEKSTPESSSTTDEQNNKADIHKKMPQNKSDEYNLKLGAICIILKDDDKELFQSTEFEKYVKLNLHANYIKMRPDAKGNLLVFPKGEEDIDKIMSSKSFFENNSRKNLGRERLAVVISNISIQEIMDHDGVKAQLNEIGIEHYDKLSFNHGPDKRVLKGICKNEETKINLINKKIDIKIGYTRKSIYIEPNIKPINQCRNCWQFGEHKESACEYEPICAICGKKKHHTDNCSEIKCCINCKDTEQNDDHPADSIKCPTRIELKKKELQRETERIKGKASSSYSASNTSAKYSRIDGMHTELTKVDEKFKKILENTTATQSQLSQYHESNNKNSANLEQLIINLNQTTNDKINSNHKEIQKELHEKFSYCNESVEDLKARLVNKGLISPDLKNKNQNNQSSSKTQYD